MDVFISWSGERSKALAEGLREFVGSVIQAAKPFMSGHDIDAGQRWLDELNEKLQTTHFGIICLTPDNLDNQWIHYEAGALGRTLGKARVCPCLYDLSNTDVEFPLAQFFAHPASKDGIRRIIESLNKAMEGHTLSESKLEKSFERCWPEMQAVIDNLPNVPAGGKQLVKRSADDMFQEILGHLRRLSTPLAPFPLLPPFPYPPPQKTISELLLELANPRSTDTFVPASSVARAGSDMQPIQQTIIRALLAWETNQDLDQLKEIMDGVTKAVTDLQKTHPILIFPVGIKRLFDELVRAIAELRAKILLGPAETPNEIEVEQSVGAVFGASTAFTNACLGLSPPPPLSSLSPP